MYTKPSAASALKTAFYAFFLYLLSERFLRSICSQKILSSVVSAALVYINNSAGSAEGTDEIKKPLRGIIRGNINNLILYLLIRIKLNF